MGGRVMLGAVWEVERRVRHGKQSDGCVMGDRVMGGRHGGSECVLADQTSTGDCNYH